MYVPDLEYTIEENLLHSPEDDEYLIKRALIKLNIRGTLGILFQVQVELLDDERIPTWIFPVKLGGGAWISSAPRLQEVVDPLVPTLSLSS